MSRNGDWIKQRSHEAYAKNYSIVYPHDEPLASRNMKKSALHSELEAAGCVFQERLGTERPGWFSPEGPSPVQPYDWYGAYGHSLNAQQTYVDRLREDYTFGFPRNHAIVSQVALNGLKQNNVYNKSKSKFNGLDSTDNKIVAIERHRLFDVALAVHDVDVYAALFSNGGRNVQVRSVDRKLPDVFF